MPRRAHPSIVDLDTHTGATITTRQVADYLRVTVRDIHALVRCGLLRKLDRPGNREFRIYTSSLREFDNIRLKRSA